MKLPRYSSTALPTEASISPEQAAATEAAKGKVISTALGAASELSLAMYNAEQQAQSDKKVAETMMQISAFQNDPQWDRQKGTVDEKGNVIDDKPTEEVMVKKWEQLRSNVGTGMEDLKYAYRSKTESAVSQMLYEAELAAQEKIDKVRIERVRTEVDDSIVAMQQAGAFGMADEIIRNAFDSGIISADTRKAYKAINDERMSIDPYQKILASGDANAIRGAAAEIIDDTDIVNPETRMKKYKEMLAEAKRIEALQNDDTNPALERNYRKIAPRLLNGSFSLEQALKAYEEGNITKARYDHIETVIRGRSSNKSDLGGLTTSAGARFAANTIREVMSYGPDAEVPYDEFIQQAKDAILADPDISTEDVMNAHNKINGLAKVVRDNPDWKQLLDIEKAAITGMSDGAMFVTSSANTEQVLAFQTMESDFYVAAMREGPNFDANAWLDANRFGYRKKAIEKYIQTDPYLMNRPGVMVYLEGNKGVDIEKTEQQLLMRSKEIVQSGELEQEVAYIWVGLQVETIRNMAGQK
jgi:hypothetical protein